MIQSQVRDDTEVILILIKMKLLNRRGLHGGLSVSRVTRSRGLGFVLGCFRQAFISHVSM